MFITIEGIDGSGKSSILKKFENEINNDLRLKNKFIFTREPGGRGVYRSEFIKNELLFNDKINNSPIVELLLFTLSRRIHLEDLIWPSLLNNKIVICDRYIDSTYAYQGQFLDKSNIKKSLELLSENSNKIAPDYTFYFQVSIENSQKRISKRESNNHLDRKPVEFYERAIKIYDEISNSEPNRVIIINANENFEKVYENFKTKIFEILLKEKNN